MNKQIIKSVFWDDLKFLITIDSCSRAVSKKQSLEEKIAETKHFSREI